MDDQRILLAHGGGGELTARLLEELILPVTGSDTPIAADSALLEAPAGRLAFTTDSYVVKPIFFRGGDIGRLAVCGTVNDLAVAGARPLYITLSLIIEEGLPLDDLKRVLHSAARAAEEAGVKIAAGDTKVVERGAAEGIYINTAGVGAVPEGVSLGPEFLTPGDMVILTGTLGDHSIAVLSEREGIAFATPVRSDVAPLNRLAAKALAAGGVKLMKDLTRGGLAGALNEIAQAGGLSIEVEETALPVTAAVRGAADMLGLDVLELANEGKMVLFVEPEKAETVLTTLKNERYGEEAAVVGRVSAAGLQSEDRCAGGEGGGGLVGTGEEPGVVLLTEVGGTRFIEMPFGEALPRIC